MANYLSDEELEGVDDISEYLLINLEMNIETLRATSQRVNQIRNTANSREIKWERRLEHMLAHLSLDCDYLVGEIKVIRDEES